MPRAIRETSTITAKGQTTVPKSVRQALGVDYGGRIAFKVDGRQVTVERAAEEHEDPLIGSFLTFLADDMERHPDGIASFSPELVARIAELTEKVEADVEAPIEGEVAL